MTSHKTNIHRLEKLAEELRAGGHCRVTRLSGIRRLCWRPADEFNFMVSLADVVWYTVEIEGKPVALPGADWVRHLKLLRASRDHLCWLLNNPLREPDPVLAPVRARLDQDQQALAGSDSVRVCLHRRRLRIVVMALSFLFDDGDDADMTSDRSYEAAIEYAGSYDRDQNFEGLTPASAPQVLLMARLFRQIHNIDN